MRLLWTIVTTMALVGCGAGFHVRTPSGFVELDDDAYDYRATDSDGVILAVRTLDNHPRGDLEFWSGAIDARLRQRYSAESVHEVGTRSGLVGVQIRYVASRSGRTHRYWATVFVDDDTVYLLEAGGDAELFDADRETVEEAIASFDAG